MIIRTLTREEAEQLFNEYQSTPVIGSYYSDLDPDYQTIRSDLLKLADIGKFEYDYDLEFAGKLYSYFNGLNGFNEMVASNYGFWRYISLKVVPDIIQHRHGLVPEYYYAKNVRVYIPTLWWYIHLSMQSSLEDTINLLSRYNTDYIVQLVERPGREGTYLEVSRRIINYLSKLPLSVINEKKNNSNLFRRVLIQNTAKINNYNLIFDGKIDEYVADLFKSCGVEEKNNG